MPVFVRLWALCMLVVMLVVERNLSQLKAILPFLLMTQENPGSLDSLGFPGFLLVSPAGFSRSRNGRPEPLGRALDFLAR